jgi:hypothetical protein
MKKLNQTQVKNIFLKCINLVKKKPAEFFNFKKMRGSEGLCNWTDIEIDYRRELLSTACHECVHYLYPDYSESMVRYIEKRIVNVCSKLDLAFFLKILSSKIYKSELQKSVLKKKNKVRRLNKKQNIKL